MRTARYLIQSLVIFAFTGSVDARESTEISPSASDGRLRVWCKDGSIFRGEIIELVPKSYVLLQLSGGRSIKIEWSKILKTQGTEDAEARPIQTPSAAQPPKPTLTPQAVPPKPTPPSAPPPSNAVTTSTAISQVANTQEPSTATASTPSVSSFPIVTVRTTGMKSGAYLEYRAKTLEIDGPVWPVPLGDQTIEEWKPLCSVPCVAKIDPELPIRLRGPSIQPTGRIWIPSRASRYEMEISPGHSGIRTGAWFSFGFGLGLLFTGSMVLGVGKHDAGTEPMSLRMLVPGGVTAGIGMAGLIASIPLFAKSATTVEFYRE